MNNSETENKKEVKEKKSNNEYFLNKEKNRIKAKINKIEKEIEQLENKVKELEKNMKEETISTDYIKLNELQEEIQKTNEEIEIKLKDWEDLNQKINFGEIL